MSLKKKNNVELLTVGASLTQRAKGEDTSPGPQKRASSIPYPFLQAFIDRESGNRPGKRVVFDHSDYDDLLGKI